MKHKRGYTGKRSRGCGIFMMVVLAFVLTMILIGAIRVMAVAL